MTSSAYATAEHEQDDTIFDTSARALSDAASDASAHARVAAQNVKDGVGWGVYKAAFGVSFGVVFTGVFLTELLPGQSSLRRGLEDGASAALDAIDARKHPYEEPLDAPESPIAAHEAEVEVAPAVSRRHAPVQSAAARAPRKRTARPRTTTSEI